MLNKRVITSLVLSMLSLAFSAVSLAREDGIAMWQLGDYAQAVTLWQQQANLGDPKAMHYLGFAYRKGKGIAQDQQKAFEWYKKAAEKGIPEAQFELGLMYEMGIGTLSEPYEAAYWYGQATEGDFCPSELPAGGVLGD